MDNTAFTFTAQGLPKQGAFAKCNAMIEIYRLGCDAKFFKVYESIVIKKNLNPQWPEFTLTSAKLCNGDVKRALQFKVYHVDKGKRKYLGKCQSNYQRLTERKEKAYPLKDTKGKQIGTLHPMVKILKREQYDAQPSPSASPRVQQQYNHAQSASNAELEMKIRQQSIRKLQIQKS